MYDSVYAGEGIDCHFPQLFLDFFFLAFLTNRTKQARVNTLLELKGISTGVPQGCVSSPILFTL